MPAGAVAAALARVLATANASTGGVFPQRGPREEGYTVDPTHCAIRLARAFLGAGADQEGRPHDYHGRESDGGNDGFAIAFRAGIQERRARRGAHGRYQHEADRPGTPHAPCERNDVVEIDPCKRGRRPGARLVAAGAQTASSTRSGEFPSRSKSARAQRTPAAPEPPPDETRHGTVARALPAAAAGLPRTRPAPQATTALGGGAGALATRAMSGVTGGSITASWIPCAQSSLHTTPGMRLSRYYAGQQHRHRHHQGLLCPPMRAPAGSAAGVRLARLIGNRQPVTHVDRRRRPGFVSSNSPLTGDLEKPDCALDPCRSSAEMAAAGCYQLTVDSAAIRSLLSPAPFRIKANRRLEVRPLWYIAELFTLAAATHASAS